MYKCIFLDRDGVLNIERGEYTYKIEDFKVIDDVPEALHTLKKKIFINCNYQSRRHYQENLYPLHDACMPYLFTKNL